MRATRAHAAEHNNTSRTLAKPKAFFQGKSFKYHALSGKPFGYRCPENVLLKSEILVKDYFTFNPS